MDKKKIALITGAGTGLGRAIAITLANQNYSVVLTGRREEKLREVEKEINKDCTIVITSDVTDEKSVKQLHKELLEKTEGQLDLLVNNVGGMTAMGRIGEMSLEGFNSVIATNLTSQFLVTNAFLPTLRKSKDAKIISVTSLMANYYVAEYGAYSASKAGMDALMKTVAEEEKENGVEVHLFDPHNIISEGNPTGEKDPMEVMDGIIEIVK